MFNTKQFEDNRLTDYVGPSWRQDCHFYLVFREALAIYSANKASTQWHMYKPELSLRAVTRYTCHSWAYLMLRVIKVEC